MTVAAFVSAICRSADTGTYSRMHPQEAVLYDDTYVRCKESHQRGVDITALDVFVMFRECVFFYYRAFAESQFTTLSIDERARYDAAAQCIRYDCKDDDLAASVASQLQISTGEDDETMTPV